MAERSQGPVKPPTIDLVARETAAGQPVEPDAAPIPDAPPLTEQPAAEPPAIEQPATAATADPPAKRPRVRKPKPTEAEVLAATASTIDPPPEPEPAPQPATMVVSEPPLPHERDWGAVTLAAVVGGVFGALLVYIAATFVPLPKGPNFADPIPVLTTQGEQIATLNQDANALGDRIAALAKRLDGIEESAIDTQMSLDATITQVDSGFSDVKQQIEDAKAATPGPVNTEGIDQRLRELAARVDAVAAGASSADAGALAANLNDLEAEVAKVRDQITAATQRIDAADTSLSALKESVAALEAKVAEAVPAPPPGPTIGDVALTGLEAALASGRPYTAELAALTRTAPAVDVPADVSAAAKTGLPPPDALVDRFTASVPDMVAARPKPADGSWQDNAVNWLGGLLAIRPAGEVEGDAPEAVLARLEAAMARRDFTAAAALFGELPPEMRAAAGTLADDVGLHADAAAWITALRGATTTGATQ